MGRKDGSIRLMFSGREFGTLIQASATSAEPHNYIAPLTVLAGDCIQISLLTHVIVIIRLNKVMFNSEFAISESLSYEILSS